jgi:epoxyqueuosine reductase
MKDRLLRLLDFVKAEGGPGVEGRVYVDTGPVLEREVAARAGLGWFGKHTGLIHKRAGSWLLLGEILLNIELDYDTPALDHCGTCTRCIDACPTGAILEPYLLDSRKCISYLTIEVRGAIPAEMRAQVGDWVFGCDVCQEVCPWNRKAPVTEEPAFAAREGLGAPDLIELLRMDRAAFSARFRGSPIKRTKRRGLLRNAAVALGNSGDRQAVPALIEALNDPEALVRGHAAWALGRLGGEEARAALAGALSREEDAEARGEIEGALEAIA